MSYAELDAASNRLARLLAGNGVRPGDRVGLLLGKSVESIVALFGVLKAGAVYVPVDPATPPARTRWIFDNCGVGFVIASSAACRALFSGPPAAGDPVRGVLIADKPGGTPDPSVGPAREIPWREILEFRDDPLADPPRTDVDPAYILHTSGSTGTPKGVVISHGNALAFVEMAADFFRVGPEDRLCNHAPLNFDLSMFDIYVAAAAGAAVVPVPEGLSVFPVRLAEYIGQTSITVWNSVSSVLGLLAARGGIDRFDLPALRLVIFSGEILPVKYLRKLKARWKNAGFYNIYGQTEANSSTYYRVEEIPEDDAWKVPIGKAFPNFDVFVLDGNGRVVESPGEEGELHVKASTVAMGYWGDEERTRERFIPDPRRPDSPDRVYKTGDLVRVGNDGNLVFCGRKDNLIKSRGYRIELDEVEIALNSHPDVGQAVAIPVPDDLLGNRILACVSPADGASADEGSILRHCGGILPKQMVPDAIRFFPALPRNPNGKVDRNRLLKIATGEETL